MSNRLVKHLLSYGIEGNAGSEVCDEVALLTAGSTTSMGICTDWSGNIYITDHIQHIIVKAREDGTVRLFAGQPGVSGMANGIATAATFNQPYGIACDRSGYLYVADSGNNQIRKIDPNGNVSLLAGSPTGVAGLDNGANRSAKFNAPWDVAVDCSGSVYITDLGNNKVRLIRGANTFDVAGAANGAAGDVLGQGTTARFNSPSAIHCDRSGKIFVGDSGNSKIKFITTDFTVRYLTGPSFKGVNLDVISFLKVDNSGYIYAVDFNTALDKSRLIRIDQEGNGGTVVAFDTRNMGIAVSPNQTLFVTQSEDPADLSSSWSSVSSQSSSSESSSSDSSVSSVSSASSISSDSSTLLMSSSSVIP